MLVPAASHSRDLTDGQWVLIGPFLPKLGRRKDGRGRPWREKDRRDPVAIGGHGRRLNRRPDGYLYLHGENRDVALLEATPDAYKENGRFTPPNQPQHTTAMEKAWPYPVVANGRLYIRDHGTLWRMTLRKRAEFRRERLVDARRDEVHRTSILGHSRQGSSPWQLATAAGELFIK